MRNTLEVIHPQIIYNDNLLALHSNSMSSWSIRHMNKQLHRPVSSPPSENEPQERTCGEPHRPRFVPLHATGPSPSQPGRTHVRPHIVSYPVRGAEGAIPRARQRVPIHRGAAGTFEDAGVLQPLESYVFLHVRRRRNVRPCVSVSLLARCETRDASIERDGDLTQCKPRRSS